MSRHLIETASEDAFIAALQVARPVALQGNALTLVTGWTAPTLAASVEIHGDGSVITGNAADNFLAPVGPVALRDLTLSGFNRPLYAVETLASTTIQLASVSILGAGAENVSIRSAFDRASFTNVTVSGGAGRGLSTGFDDGTHQAGWGFYTAIGCTVSNLGNISTNQTAGFLSYAGGKTVFAFNLLNGIGATSSTNELDGFYTKSPHGLIIGNSATGFAGNGVQFMFNLKGGVRGAVSGALGYGGFAAFNAGVGASGKEVGVRAQNDEASVICNHIENVPDGVQLGSDSLNLTLALGNLLRIDGTVNSKGTSASATVAGTTSSGLVHALNRIHGADIGMSLSTGNAAILKNVRLGDMIDGLLTNAYKVAGQSGTPITNLLLSGAIIDGGTTPISFTFVEQSLIDGVLCVNATNIDRPISLVSCHDIHIRDWARSLQIVGATATTAFRMTLPAGSAAHVRWTVVGTDTTSAQAFSYVVEADVWLNGATATLIGSPTVTGNSTTGAPTVTIDVTSADFRCRITPPATLTWNIRSWTDVKMR